MSRKIIIVGTGGHASVIADAIRAQTEFEIAAVCDDSASRIGAEFEQLTVTSFSDVDPRDVPWAIVAIGDNHARRTKAAEVQNLGFRLATIVHPSATVSPSATLGSGSVVFAGAVVNARAVLGDNVIVNTGASIDHHANVEDDVHVAPGARLAGDVTINRGAFIGMGACVLPGVSVGKNAVVGAGAIVVRSVQDEVTVVGTPARVIERQP